MTVGSANSNVSQLTVAVRIRPMNEEEKQRRNFPCVYPLDNKRVLLVDPEKFENNILRQNRQHERQFVFDSAFGHDSTHEGVHSATTAPLVNYVVEGYNATVFAYGPTGSGKTFTMVGTKETPGLMTLLTRDLYAKMNPNEFTVYLSYLEIYNEVIRDLLNPNAGILDLLEDEKGNVQVPGLSRVKAPNTLKIMNILQEGNSRRTQEPTAANKTSSRSHALLQVTLYKNSVQHGKLFLIDLAGSERASQTQNKGQRLKEGAAINRSLLALGNVINALSSGGKGRYVNYRDSKLTRLLKDSLGGNSKTCMIAHVTPSSSNYDETYNTLVYANRAKNITTRLVQHRPASADQLYNKAIKEIQHEASKRSQMTHAISSHQISEKGLSDKNSVSSSDKENNTYRQVRWSNTTRITTNAAIDASKFSSLFNSLKDQYLINTEKQHKFRERLLKANHESYDVEMSRTAKLAILSAWEKHTKEDEERYSDIIQKLKNDVVSQESRLSQLQELRQKTEKALRKGAETLKSLENRMRSLAKDVNQNEVVDLLVRMAENDAEKMAITSDYSLQNLRIRKQENSLMKIHKYEQIADRLIAGDLNDPEREQILQEYRIIKNQLNYTLVPLKQDSEVVSWNSMLLHNNPKHGRRLSLTNTLDLGKTYTVADFQAIQKHKKEMLHLPVIDTVSSSDSSNEKTTETQSTVEQLPRLST